MKRCSQLAFTRRFGRESRFYHEQPHASVASTGAAGQHTMPTPISLFLNTRAPVEDVRVAVSNVVGRELQLPQHDAGPVYATMVLEIELRPFNQHGLEDDRGLEFTVYPLQLMLVARERGIKTEGFDAAYESIASFLAVRLASSLGCRVIVVANLQHQLAAFEG